MSNNHQYAFIIGVGRRPDDVPALAITAADATCIYEKLTGACGFVKDNVHLITESNTNRTKIINQVDILISQTQQRKADLVLIFFSGHGYTKDNKYYLIAYDTDKNDIENTAIDGSIFINKINQISTAKLVLLLDCCHAGGFADQPETSVPFSTEDFLHNTNRVIITSSGKGEKSYTGEPVSVFTYALIEGLHGKDLREDTNRINVFDLALFVRERTRALTKKIQNPGFDVLPKSFTGNFTIVDYQNKKPDLPAFEKAFKLYTDGKEVDVTDDFSAGEDQPFRQSWCDKLKIKEADIGFVRVKEMNVEKSFFENAHFKNPTFDVFQTKDEAKDEIIRNQFLPVTIIIQKDKVVYRWKKNIDGKITEKDTDVKYSDADLHLNVSDFFIQWAKAVQQYDDNTENNFQILGKLLARFIDLEDQLSANLNVLETLFLEPDKNVKIGLLLEIKDDAGVLCNLPWEYLFIAERQKETVTGKSTDYTKKYPSFFISADKGLQFQFIRQTKPNIVADTAQEKFTIVVLNGAKLSKAELEKKLVKMKKFPNSDVHEIPADIFKDTDDFISSYYNYIRDAVKNEWVSSNYVLHYIGETRAENNEYKISFGAENTVTEYMNADSFARVFEYDKREEYNGSKTPPKLVFIDADYSAKITTGNSSIAFKLSCNDIPAVIGFLDKLPSEARDEFADKLYLSLAKGENVATAVTIARQSLKFTGVSAHYATRLYQFGIPVLFISTRIPVKIVHVQDSIQAAKHGETSMVGETKYCPRCGKERIFSNDKFMCDIHRIRLTEFIPDSMQEFLHQSSSGARDEAVAQVRSDSNLLSAKEHNK